MIDTGFGDLEARFGSRVPRPGTMPMSSGSQPSRTRAASAAPSGDVFDPLTAWNKWVKDMGPYLAQMPTSTPDFSAPGRAEGFAGLAGQHGQWGKGGSFTPNQAPAQPNFMGGWGAPAGLANAPMNFMGTAGTDPLPMRGGRGFSYIL